MNVMEDLKAYIDGELSPERRSEVEVAIEQDAALRQEMEEIRVLSRLIGDCVVELEPVGLSETLKILERRKPRPLFVRLFKEPRQFAWVWAMSLFILLAVFLPLMKGRSYDQAAVAYGAEDKAASPIAKGDSSRVFSDVNADSTGSAAKPSSPAPEDPERNINGARGAPLMDGATAASPAEHGKNAAGRIGFGSSAGGFGGGKGAVRGGQESAGVFVNPKTGLKDPSLRMPERVTRPVPAAESSAKAARKSPVQQAEGQSQGAQPPLLIRTGDLTVQVGSVKATVPVATTLAKSLGGYVESSSSASDENNVPQAQMTLRVPEPKFDQAMTRLRSLGVVKSESVTGQDVTAQVADVEARVKVLRTSEQSYLVMLAKARKVDDALSIRDRLDDVRQQIESMTAQAKTLRNQATYSTITLALTEKQEAPKPAPQPSWFDTAWSGATERASGLGKWLAEVGMNLVLLAPAWVPIVGLAWWLGRRKRR